MIQVNVGHLILLHTPTFPNKMFYNFLFRIMNAKICILRIVWHIPLDPGKINNVRYDSYPLKHKALLHIFKTEQQSLGNMYVL